MAYAGRIIHDISGAGQGRPYKGSEALTRPQCSPFTSRSRGNQSVDKTGRCEVAAGTSDGQHLSLNKALALQIV